jgi:membrane protein
MTGPGEEAGSVDRLRAIAGRVAERVGGLRATQVLVGILAAYDGAGGGLTASGLAYTSLIALLPGLLLMVSIFGLVISDPATQEQLVAAIAEAVPPLEDFAKAAFSSVSAGAVPTGLIAIVGLVWGSSRFYAALDYAFTRIFQDGRPRNEIERTVRGIIVTFLLVAVPLGALVFSLVAGWLTSVAPGGIAGLVIQVLSPLGSFILFVLGTVLVYRYVPAKHVPWRALLPPALLAGVVLAGFAQLYAIFAPMLTRMAAIYGTFVAFFAILAWLSISFNILLFGASWTRVREQELAGDGGATDDDPTTGDARPADAATIGDGAPPADG